MASPEAAAINFSNLSIRQPEPPRHNGRDVYVEGRVVASGFMASRAFQIPTELCATRNELEWFMLVTFRATEPLILDYTAMSHRIPGQFPPLRSSDQSNFSTVFVLEETVHGNKHSNQHKAFSTVLWENHQEVHRWYDRNILKGTATKLRVEIHIGWKDQVNFYLPGSDVNKDPDEAWNEYIAKLTDAGLGKGDLDRVVYLEWKLLRDENTGKFDFDEPVAAPTTTQFIPALDVQYQRGCEICQRARDAVAADEDDAMDLD